MSKARVGALVFGIVALTGCEMLKPPSVAPFETQIRVSGDPGEPLAGVEVVYRQKVVGTTDESGLVKLQLKGGEGTNYEFSVRCPKGYSSPPKPLSVVLRRAEGGARAEYQVECAHENRSVVVAVRADSGPNLPVKYLGKEVARTDQSGAAHVLLLVPPNQVFQLELSTDGAKDLRPQNPTASFEVKQTDAVLLFDQKFKVEKKIIQSAPRKRDDGPKPLEAT